MHSLGSHIQTNTTSFKIKLYDRKRELLAFRASVLTYELNLYQHIQIHTNPTLLVDQGRVSAAQVAAMGPHMHLLQLISHN